MDKNNKMFAVVMLILCVLTVGVFAGSVYLDMAKNAREAKKVAAISEIEIPAVPNLAATRDTGVITAEEWKSYYPEIYATYMKNAENTGTNGVRVQYPETTPQIQTLYQGMAFSFAYDEAIGHNYTLDDISATARPHKLANCLTCKTPDFTATVNSMGTEAYKVAFEDMITTVSEPVSCYSCHGNNPGTIDIVSDYMAEGFCDEIASGAVDKDNVACAQCHIEYYFDPETKATKIPYDSLSNMNPDDILAFYNEIGFKDYTNENTGVNQIKVQHPEFETYLADGSYHRRMYNCADCHMGVTYDKDGNPFADHELTSPLDNQELLDTTCSTCHADLSAKVAMIQNEITTREDEVADLLVEVNTKLAAKVAEGKMTEEQLNEIRQLDRNAQFYWDFVYVENSEGAHNSIFTRECLDKAEKIAKEALAKLE